MRDLHVQVSPGQRVLIHDDQGVAKAALIIDLEHRHPRQQHREATIQVQFRSPHMISYAAQEWVHPEDGEEI